MRRLYAERRDATVAGLESELGNYVDIRCATRRHAFDPAFTRPPVGPDGSLRVWVKTARTPKHFRLGRGTAKPDRALLVGFTNVDSQATAAQLGKRILALM